MAGEVTRGGDIAPGRGTDDKDGDTCGACGAVMGSAATHAKWHIDLSAAIRKAPGDAIAKAMIGRSL